jgi:hypothetical protein
MKCRFPSWLLLMSLFGALTAQAATQTDAETVKTDDAQKAYQDYLSNPGLSATMFTAPRQFLNAQGLSTVDQGEDYISAQDPAVGPRFNCAKLSILAKETNARNAELTHNGVAQALEPTGDKPGGYQLRVFWSEGGQLQHETRTVFIKTTGSTNKYTFRDGFTRAPQNICLEYERVGSLTTFEKWRDHAFGAGQDGNLLAKYYNSGDLHLGRRIVGGQAHNSTSMYVMNFRSLSDAVNWKAADGYGKVVAIVALEHSGGTLKYSIYDGGNSFGGIRRAGVVLDTGGTKYLPNVCSICHNNNFVPIDVANQQFSSTAGATLAEQQGVIKQFNQLMIDPANQPQTHLRELVNGWYANGGNIQNSNYVPPAWIADAQLYLNIVGPNCRSCHITQDQNWIDDNRMMHEDAGYFAFRVCYARTPMPNAQETHGQFFRGEAPRLFQRSTNMPIACLPAFTHRCAELFAKRH